MSVDNFGSKPNLADSIFRGFLSEEGGSPTPPLGLGEVRVMSEHRSTLFRQLSQLMSSSLVGRLGEGSSQLFWINFEVLLLFC